MYGFKGGPAGVMKCKYVQLTNEFVYPYRNQGGFDMICSGRDKIETPKQFQEARETVKKLDLDGLVIIGGDDSNTNACLLAENFRASNLKTLVIGCPKTIDGDLKCKEVPTSFGFDTACKIYSEMIGNLMVDARSTGKYYHFVRLMGRAASHITLECALQTHPNITIIGEEVSAQKQTLKSVTDYITNIICKRADAGFNYGIILIPEGLIDFIPEVQQLISELNEILAHDVVDQKGAWKNKLRSQSHDLFEILPSTIQEQLLLERDPHGNVQVAKIETEKMIIQMVEAELENRKKKGKYKKDFKGQPHFFGYEGRCGLPSNFDSNYCYALGYGATALLHYGKTGLISSVGNLGAPVEDWTVGGTALTSLMDVERRHGKFKPVIKKALVELEGAPFKKFASMRDEWSIKNRYINPGNFIRIRSAFAYGAKTLARLLDCPKENLVTEINQFFTNTWDRHGNGIRPDASVTDSLVLTQISDPSSKKSESIVHETDFNSTQSSNYQSGSSPKVHANKGQRNLKSGLLVNDIQRSPFARTRSSPELTDTYKYVPFQRTSNKPPENEKKHNRKKNIEHENEKNEHSSLHLAPPQQSFEASNVDTNVYKREDLQQEEQDLVNMMASSQFHGFNGPVNLATGHLPFPISPSFLASLGYTQKNFPGMIPTNMPFIDPQFSGMQFPPGLVPHYFPGVGMNSNSEDSVDQFNENNLGDNNNNNNNYNHDLWREPDRVISEIVPQDDKPQSSSSTGMNYVPPPRRVGGSGGLVRSQQKNSKEKRERLRDNNHLDHHSHHSDERATSSRFSSAAHSNSLKSKTSSESSWDETSSTVIKSTKEKRGKKMANPIDDRMQSEDDDKDWIRVPPTNLTSDSESQTISQTSGSGPSGPVIPMGPMGPMIIGSNPRQRMMDNSGGTPLTFYPTGPPVPFLTMLPFCNVPSENGVDQSDISQNSHSEGVDQSEEFSLQDTLDGTKSNILNSDFASHWRNLQFGRFCQSPRHHGPTVYSSPVMVPPVYLQGRVPWDGPGRPVPNVNLVTQLMNYGPRLVPVAPHQSVPSRPPNVYQHYVEDMPRYRSGTGTYLPNPKVGGVRERPRRGNYNYEKNENHVDREGNWTVNSKSRGNGRNHNRNQMDKSTANRLGSSGSRSVNSNSHRQHDSFSGSSQSGPPVNMAYGMYPIPGVPNNGSNGPAVVMVYPYEQNAGFPLQSEQQQLEFGSFVSGGYSGMNEQQSPRGSRGTLEDHNRLYGSSTQRSSPDQPSSPHHHRRV